MDTKSLANVIATRLLERAGVSPDHVASIRSSTDSGGNAVMDIKVKVPMSAISINIATEGPVLAECHDDEL